MNLDIAPRLTARLGPKVPSGNPEITFLAHRKGEGRQNRSEVVTSVKKRLGPAGLQEYLRPVTGSGPYVTGTAASLPATARAMKIDIWPRLTRSDGQYCSGGVVTHPVVTPVPKM